MRKCEYTNFTAGPEYCDDCENTTDLFFLYGNGPAPWQKATPGEEVREPIFYCEFHRPLVKNVVTGGPVHWYREEELFNTPEEGTFRLTVHSVPTTKEDRAVIAWAASFGGWPEPGEFIPGGETAEDVITSQFFVLPYEQGGGHVELTKVTAEEYEQELCENNGFTLEELEADGIEEQWFENKANFTGWIYHDHYSDSMTHEFTSPVYRFEDENDFYTEAM